MEEIGGLSITSWMLLWAACHTSGFSGPTLVAWPDGKSLLEQPALTVEVFAMIREQNALAAQAAKPLAPNA